MTINYIEKGYGLHEAIRAAGHWLVQRDGLWISSNDVVVQAIIDSYTLAQTKAAKQRAVLAKAKETRDRAVVAVSAGELASWSIKRSEALAFAEAGDLAQCPMLSVEAAERGITVAALVAKVNANAAAFSTLEAQIGGTDGRHRDAITALGSFEAVAAYDYSTGWPEV
ncbi:MAG: hypothetical protein K2X55_02345 [Burkholderiaceae bacterium]|nr:hypothetical protein [Burkholderiaceae bacterium]